MKVEAASYFLIPYFLFLIPYFLYHQIQHQYPHNPQHRNNRFHYGPGEEGLFEGEVEEFFKHPEA